MKASGQRLRRTIPKSMANTPPTFSALAFSQKTRPQKKAPKRRGERPRNDARKLPLSEGPIKRKHPQRPGHHSLKSQDHKDALFPSAVDQARAYSPIRGRTKSSTSNAESPSLRNSLCSGESPATAIPFFPNAEPNDQKIAAANAKISGRIPSSFSEPNPRKIASVQQLVAHLG